MFIHYALVGFALVVSTTIVRGQPSTIAQDNASLAEARTKAEAGDPAAQSSLGWASYNGDGVAEDAVEAVKWFRRSAEQGNPSGQNRLGVAYRVRQGCPEGCRSGAHLVSQGCGSGPSAGAAESCLDVQRRSWSAARLRTGCGLVTVRPRSRGMPARSPIWELRMRTAKASRRTGARPSDGSRKPATRVTRSRRSGLQACIGTKSSAAVE